METQVRVLDGIRRATLLTAGMLALGATGPSFADGTDTLGPPSIGIADTGSRSPWLAIIVIVTRSTKSAWALSRADSRMSSASSSSLAGDVVEDVIFKLPRELSTKAASA